MGGKQPFHTLGPLKSSKARPRRDEQKPVPHYDNLNNRHPERSEAESKDPDELQITKAADTLRPPRPGAEARGAPFIREADGWEATVPHPGAVQVEQSSTPKSYQKPRGLLNTASVKESYIYPQLP
jgi:hypothetical protein